VTYIQVCQGNGPLVLRLDIGSRVPMATSALGRAFLAATPEVEREMYYEQIRQQDPAAWPALERSLQSAYEEYEQYGFCTSDGEWNRDVSGVAVPLILDGGAQVVPFNCGGSSLRLSRRTLLENLGPRLKDVVGQVAQMVQGRA